MQAAFICKNTWPAFPKGSIHLLSVNDFYGPKVRFLAIRHREHFFIGPDNGIFSLIFDQTPEEAYELSIPEEERFPLKTIFSAAVGHIIGEQPFGKIGQAAEGLLHRITFQPVIGPSLIRGSVIHIDNFENVILNITEELFAQVGRNRPFSLLFKRHEPITSLCSSYHDVPVGEPLCLFNSAGLMEIAVNMGRAGSLLGLNLEDSVQIDFSEDAPSGSLLPFK